MNSRVIFVTVLAMATAGCQAPLVALHGPSFQPKVEYVNDWNGLADKVATRFASTLHMEPPFVYVVPGPADMAFAPAFRTQLEKALMDRGYPIVDKPDGAVVLNFDVQTFLYAGKQRWELQAPWTTLARLMHANYGF